MILLYTYFHIHLFFWHSFRLPIYKYFNNANINKNNVLKESIIIWYINLNNNDGFEITPPSLKMSPPLKSQPINLITRRVQNENYNIKMNKNDVLKIIFIKISVVLFLIYDIQVLLYAAAYFLFFIIPRFPNENLGLIKDINIYY